MGRTEGAEESAPAAAVVGLAAVEVPAAAEGPAAVTSVAEELAEQERGLRQGKKGHDAPAV